ncbi:hypothetical protein D3C87_2058810 [compost metagenome]
MSRPDKGLDTFLNLRTPKRIKPLISASRVNAAPKPRTIRDIPVLFAEKPESGKKSPYVVESLTTVP